jgi:ureidoacrylate peracid hydrolase
MRDHPTAASDALSRQPRETAPTFDLAAVRPSATALLVVDLQNDYCAPGGAFDAAGHDISPMQALPARVAMLAEHARDAGVLVVFVQNTVDPAGRMRTALQRRKRVRLAGTPGYVVDGTWGHQFAEPLVPTEADIHVRKYTSSAFGGTPLDQTLRAARIELVAVTGVVTWGCVLATAHGAAALGYIPVVVSDCVGGEDAYLHDAALAMMRRSFGHELVVPSSTLVGLWTGSDGRPASNGAVPAEGGVGRVGKEVVAR